MHPKFQHLPHRIRERRKDLGFRQSDLAEKTGILQSAISMLENGQQDAVSDENLLKLLDVLDITPEPAAMLGPIYGFCPAADCPYLRLKLHRMRLLPQPLIVQTDLDTTESCPCGKSALEVTCPECREMVDHDSSSECPGCHGTWLKLSELESQPDFSLVNKAWDTFRASGFTPEESLRQLDSLDKLIERVNQERDDAYPRPLISKAEKSVEVGPSTHFSKPELETTQN